MNQSSVAKYYINPPYEARLVNESRRRGGEDWLSILGNAFTMEEGDYELVDITIRINPNDFGLIEGDAQQRAQRNRYEVWRFRSEAHTSELQSLMRISYAVFCLKKKI